MCNGSEKGIDLVKKYALQKDPFKVKLSALRSQDAIFLFHMNYFETNVKINQLKYVLPRNQVSLL